LGQGGAAVNAEVKNRMTKGQIRGVGGGGGVTVKMGEEGSQQIEDGVYVQSVRPFTV